tara:strand:- start:950 stop:1327 length:378 start_codon:yes stop_codon:yes gene_type:complete
MPTICEITAQLKERKIKGYSGKTKAQMMSMLEGKTPAAKKETKKTSKKEPKKEPPKLLTNKKTETVDRYADKSFIFLKKLAFKLESLANDENATESERVVAESKFKRVAAARDVAKAKQYQKKKK